MVDAYGMENLRTVPSLVSRHTEGKAVDMSISWEGTLKIRSAGGKFHEITTLPRTEMNRALHAVGATYKVFKSVAGDADRPHWSTDGR